MDKPLVTKVFKLADGRRIRLEMPGDIWELLEQSTRQIRSQRRQDRRYLIYTNSIDEIEDDAVAVAQEDVADLLIRMDRRRQLHAAMDELPTALRRMVYLYYFCGLTHREIAHSENVHHSTVSRSLKLALEMWRFRQDRATCTVKLSHLHGVRATGYSRRKRLRIF